ncbi:MAG: helix-turn-helix transcriptional regulator [Oscillospiraceae bacterium]|nr:helix-turn-helix transcriptional regulator [Oscillospiraceae bacterium]
MAEKFNQRMYDIGQNIRRLRREAGMSQTDLALAMDTSKNAISRWESGERILKLDSLLRLSDVLGVASSEILKTQDDPAYDEWETIRQDIDKLPENDKNYILRTVRLLLCGMRTESC